ncbi:MAG: type 2 isopentenyl-diphosphate Delta-isomerase [Melioribacteraceae bacterium]|nr:type 2 isopentenyl-diphosphate Delta-isomerase [Melioribacteraceae bacterium]
MNNGTVQRKKDHISLCLTDDVAFKSKSNGFENYDFEHYAITEVELNKIDTSVKFFSKKISYPFLISCMTGGTTEAEHINEMLAVAANQMNIPIGVGSQRQALENKKYHKSYKVIRANAGNVPVLGNLGAAQVVRSKKIIDEVKFLIDLVEADAFVIHINPLQELLQKEGEPDFKGLMKNLEKLTSKISIPFIAKEVGAGISAAVAKRLLEAGIKGIDVAGAGGTSWASVELKRTESKDNYFNEWGLPTSYCVRTVSELKRKYNFMLIASGGINSPEEIAKSLMLGADLAASARKILLEVNSNGVKGVIELIESWFAKVKNIMYLTGSPDIKNLKKKKLIRKTELY